MPWHKFSHGEDYSPDTAIDEQHPVPLVNGKVVDCSKRELHAWVPNENKKGYDSCDRSDLAVRLTQRWLFFVSLDSLHAGGTKSVLAKFGPVLVSKRLPT